MKLLYDIYHMQIMEGDIIRTIRDNIQYIGHFHTGGVPGRHEHGRNRWPPRGAGAGSRLGPHRRASSLTKDLALELAPVRVNLIAAGFVDTPLSASLLGDQLDARREQLRATLPIRRVVGPEDVAALAVHLMTNTALTGATYDIDGGQQLA